MSKYGIPGQKCSLCLKVFLISGWSSCGTQDSSCPLYMCSVPVHEQMQIFHWNSPLWVNSQSVRMQQSIAMTGGRSKERKPGPVQTKGEPEDIQCIPPPWKSARALDPPHLCKPERGPKTESKEHYSGTTDTFPTFSSHWWRWGMQREGSHHHHHFLTHDLYLLVCILLPH